MNKLILFGGGVDSYLLAKRAIPSCTLLYISYGCKAEKAEIKSLENTANKFGHSIDIIELPTELFDSSLIEGSYLNMNAVMDFTGQHATYITNRNYLFLLIAVNYAKNHGYNVIESGIIKPSSEAVSPFPDCRPKNLVPFIDIILMGTTGIAINLPLLHKTKEYVMSSLDAQDLQIAYSCYESEEMSSNFPWGRGCGKCPSCRTKIDIFNKQQSL